MGRGVSSGGGQSSLGYLFGSDEGPKPAVGGAAVAAVPAKENASATGPLASAAISSKVENATTLRSEVPAGVPGKNSNNYHRADGQNTGNFITDRPSTKVHAAPGGGSSLDYLFGGNSSEDK